MDTPFLCYHVCGDILIQRWHPSHRTDFYYDVKKKHYIEHCTNSELLLYIVTVSAIVKHIILSI